jgi:iron uptake system component EfeO
MPLRGSRRLHSVMRRSAAAAAAACMAGCGGGTTPSGTTAAGTPTSAAPVVPVKLSDAGCTPSNFSLHPGTIIFSVTNTGSTTVEEMEVDDEQGHVRGDVEGVQPGQTRSFVVDLAAGTYEVRCPQQATTFGTLTVA